MAPSVIPGMGDRPRDDHGQYRAEHTDEEILDAVRAHEPAATREVAETVGYDSRSAAEYRLRKLEDAGRVQSKKVGRELVWMLANGEDPEEVDNE